MGKVFEYSVIVREHNLDTLGHLNNASYLQLFEEARWDFSDKGGFGLDWVLSNKQSPIVLKAEMSFRKEVLNREALLIQSEFVGFKNSLIGSFKQKMIKSNKKVASILSIDVGFMDLKERKLMNFPKNWVYMVE
ncbi:MAG: acyl-CoA thioesterase [Bdellovibrionota bacterium]|nr:acyl-CoA thioesterase [Bdellovibrionota bacterium]MEC8623357.1 acyl-CoA thioesterase [Bdellovibrionota bacterium]